MKTKIPEWKRGIKVGFILWASILGDLEKSIFSAAPKGTKTGA